MKKGDGPQKWEKIAIPKKVSAEAQNTILVNDKASYNHSIILINFINSFQIWFYGASDRFIEFNCSKLLSSPIIIILPNIVKTILTFARIVRVE
jgi:hypothetical protein